MPPATTDIRNDGDDVRPGAVDVPDAPAIRITGVNRVFTRGGSSFTAIRDVHLEVQQGEFLSVVGPSGCGKSTLLNLLAGLAKPDGGTVETFGAPVRGVNPDVGFIFQRDALLPWRTAVQNVALPLRYRGADKRAATEKAREWLARVGLAKFTDSYPHQLSGGMRKRVAIAATLVYEPRIILMDEPFSALDVQTRTLMEDDLLKLWSASRPAVLFITHDLEEAVGLSDRVVVMSASPGHVIGDHVVPLERPRDLLEIRFDQQFTETHERIWDQLRTEVVRSRVD
ncbi:MULTISPECIES: ABC transporter ATP-binding protein [Pseudonocardia]|uniref:Bicarbonate transport ATP-binding protein CmpD n=2 Tax=Pseudonocardia TaxID=1847 RepID=A0A1Y2N025_PSEAH|nr:MULTISPECIES: ABC transporter ATP-binding protein [Pseudonocardia]OSY40813.1 Bicarbonate transport ATP-binding protein CmpD [Pseudonocardia autotrophica]TDN71879.1 NitT/TauT family transport system ATP-binding protein [Pseudonocardia autotrophica]BBG02567.1 ABC transporter ATP-binding protein [Pseudonocardia autotrophica]GEC24626.1 ABC transporter ATP-binding protein [Pseudonocardia saturnea]